MSFWSARVWRTDMREWEAPRLADGRLSCNSSVNCQLNSTRWVRTEENELELELFRHLV